MERTRQPKQNPVRKPEPDLRRPMTTGVVAKIAGVSIQMVNRWVDKGHLKGYKLPGSKDRRITHSALREFIKANQFPTDRYEAYLEGGIAAIEDEIGGSD